MQPLSRPPSKGLIIRQPWISAILDGRKIWELRGSSTRVRGRIGLIASGTGTILGEVDIVGIDGPLTLSDLVENEARHLVTIGKSSPIRYKSVYAWVMARPHRYEKPVPYSHPQGAVIWVNIG
jgi:hypothetical protein